MHCAKTDQVIAMTRKMDNLVEAILTDRTLGDFYKIGPRVA